METEMNLETAQIADGIPRPKISDSTQHWSRLDDAVTPFIPGACVAIIVDLKQPQSGSKKTCLLTYTRFPGERFRSEAAFSTGCLDDGDDYNSLQIADEALPHHRKPYVTRSDDHGFPKAGLLPCGFHPLLTGGVQACGFLKLRRSACGSSFRRSFPLKFYQ